MTVTDVAGERQFRGCSAQHNLSKAESGEQQQEAET